MTASRPTQLSVAMRESLSLSRPAIEGFLFSYAEARKHSAQKVVRSKLTSNFTQRLLSRAQLFGDKLTSPPLLQLPRTFLHTPACTRQRIEMPLPRRDSPCLRRVEPHCELEMR